MQFDTNPSIQNTENYAKLQPPEFGEYWPEQGGIYCGILPAFDGHPRRYMIASVQESPGLLTWGPITDVISDASSSTDGRANTEAILAFKREHGGVFDAAEWASQYEADGHKDFHLPSQSELFLASLYAGEKFIKNSRYWSSTVMSNNGAFVHDFEYGFSDWSLKHYTYLVRAFRWIPFPAV